MQRLFAILLAATMFMAVATGAHGAEPPRLIRDEEIERALKALAAPVFEEAGLSPDAVRFILVENNELNAFVAGGQNIFIHSGLILKTKNPSELVGVIAHETGHIAAGHLFRTREAVGDLSFQALLANLLGIAAAIGTKSGEVGAAIGSAGQTYATRTILRHSRVQESAADQAGVRFLKGAGLPLSGFLSFMETMESQELLPESQQTEYVRTHPLTQDRVDFLRQAEKEGTLPATPAAWDDLHARMKAKLLGFLFPDRALQDKSDTLPARYGQSIAHYRQGRIDKALALLDGLLAREPENPWFLELKGQILFESGKVPESVPVYAAAVAMAPQAGLIRAAYGHALLETALGKSGKERTDLLSKAVSEMNKSLDTEPLSPRTHRLLATAYGRMGNDGLSRLHLAEEALLQGNTEFAKREALLAKTHLPGNGPAAQRLADILDAISKKQEEDRKKK